MIVGNEQAQKILSTYFHHVATSQEVTFPFLLLHGPQHIGKTTIVENYIHTLLGSYRANDYLPLYDLSGLLQKKHTFKVAIPAKDQQLEIHGQRYTDMGTRDIVQWLSLSPVGQYKVVFLENIERMSGSASNAFLKTFEEPLPNRIIIATTSNKDDLLDTIVSRALVIPFQIPPAKIVADHIDAWYPEKTPEQRLFAVSFSLGRIGLAKQLLDDADDEMIQLFSGLVTHIRDGGHVVETYTALQQLEGYAGAHVLLDALMYALTQSAVYTKTNKILQIRSRLNSNVSIHNLLFDLSL